MGDGTTANKWDSVIPFDKLWEQYRRIIKPSGAIVLFGSEPFSSALVMSNPKWFKHEWIWYKRFPGNFANAKIQPLRVHENISVFCKGKCPYHPQMIKRDKPIKAGGNNMNIDVYNKFDPKEEYEGRLYFEKFPESIIEFSSRTNPSDHFHPTQKPVDLLRYLVLTYTNEGDTVLDNCSGSGTTAVAAWREKRHFICFEKDPVYWEMSVKRLKNEMMQQRLF